MVAGAELDTTEEVDPVERESCIAEEDPISAGRHAAAERGSRQRRRSGGYRGGALDGSDTKLNLGFRCGYMPTLDLFIYHHDRVQNTYVRTVQAPYTTDSNMVYLP
jgi:hypothetical protein